MVLSGGWDEGKMRLMDGAAREGVGAEVRDMLKSLPRGLSSTCCGNRSRRSWLLIRRPGGWLLRGDLVCDLLSVGATSHDAQGLKNGRR